MLGNYGRSFTKAIFTPVARLLDRLHVTPNMITLIGTSFSCGISVLFLARGYLWLGAVLLAVVLLFDSVDGILARMTGTSSDFGAFLDSTLDRVTDGFVFGALLWWVIMGLPDSAARTTGIVAGIVAMTAVGVVPYTRAKAEAYGIAAKVGIAERADRLIVALAGAALFDLGLSVWVFSASLVWVASASVITILQRIIFTYQSFRSGKAPANEGRHG